jgi:uncharacterized protein
MWRPRLIVLQPTPYCNISCDYCYLGHRDDRRLMSRAVVDAIRNKLLPRMASEAAPHIIWHAGEPTTVPLDWYDQAYAELRPAAPAAATFGIQTNGIAISSAWIDFLIRTGTRVGLSIDGPQRFHDRHRRTRAGTPTWSIAVESLARLQSAGLRPHVITVLHSDCLSAADEFYRFYRDHGIDQVSFSIDELQGANRSSSFGGADHKAAMVAFLQALLRFAAAERYALHVRDIERIAHLLSAGGTADNEQVNPWDVVAIAADGAVTSFSPDFMELTSVAHNDFRFGNIVWDDFDEIVSGRLFKHAYEEIHAGVTICRASCRYFGICGGGAPSNKMAENGSLASGETSFCRLSIQASADALIGFLQEARGNLQGGAAGAVPSE